MNTKLLGATFVAIAALVGTPIMAEAITDLNAARFQIDDEGDFKSIVFKTQDIVPKDGLVIPGGYAIYVYSGEYIAVTSHPGFLDSAAQTDENDPIWHSHLIQATINDRCLGDAVDAISWEEPSASVLVREDSSNILVRTIAIGDDQTYTDAISGEEIEFDVSALILTREDRPNGPSGLIRSISFDLNVVEDDGTICIGEAAPSVQTS